MSAILVVGELNEGVVASHTFELLAAARTLSDAGGGDVHALVAGDSTISQSLFEGGADAVHIATNEILKSGLTVDVFLPTAINVIESMGADIVLLAQTAFGRDFGPALAFKLNVGSAMECTGLTLDNGRLQATRSCYGGSARAEVTWSGPIQIATLKPKTWDALVTDTSRSGTVNEIDIAGEARVKIISTKKAEATGVRLEDAEVVVSGGRGLGDPEAFGALEELGSLLNGATGASRAACDLGWYPPSQQVGLTGKTVTPNLYIAVAISGASQHMAGMSGSKNIVAINKDADSNMVQSSRFAVIEDYKKVIPALIEEIKSLD
jgi:electron transfer flavoprotein alpha subunit